MGVILHDLGLVNDFLDASPKAQVAQENKLKI